MRVLWAYPWVPLRLTAFPLEAPAAADQAEKLTSPEAFGAASAGSKLFGTSGLPIRLLKLLDQP